MFSREDMRSQFEEVGPHQVSRSIGSNIYPTEWEQEAVLWLAEVDAERDRLRDAEVQKTIRLARSAAIAAWIAVVVSLVGVAVSVAL